VGSIWSVKRSKDKTLGGEEEEKYDDDDDDDDDEACYCALKTERNVGSNLRKKVRLISY
jgi:hypothetical protein